MNGYLGTLSRHKTLILVVVALMTGTAYYVTRGQAPQYQATSKVLVNQNSVAALPGVAPATTDPVEIERLTSTQIGLAQTPGVAKAALGAAHVRGVTPEEFLPTVHLSQEANADLVDIAVTARTPLMASRLSTAYANAFATSQSRLLRTQLSRELFGVKATIDKELRNAQSSPESGAAAGNGQTGTSQGSGLAGSPGIGQPGTVASNQAALVNSQSFQNLVSVRDYLEAAQTSSPRNSVVVSAAQTATQTAPKPLRNSLLALTLGLILGSGLAFMIDARDDRARSTREISDRLNLSLLARIPSPPRRWRAHAGPAVAMLSDPASAHAEAIKMLQANLELANLHGVQVVLLTSATRREGKSTTVANLAVSLAQSARSVVVVDADLRQPTLSRLFNVSKEFGLTELALGELAPDRLQEVLVDVKLDAALTPPCVRGSLRVLPAGRREDQPDRLLSSPACPAVFEALRTCADWILVDTPPMADFYDAFTVSRHVDALVAVARLSYVRLATLAEFGRLLASAPAAPLGFVATGVGHRNAAAYDRSGPELNSVLPPDHTAGAHAASGWPD
jgi:polysaccharide biosynthesis transport protein